MTPDDATPAAPAAPVAGPLFGLVLALVIFPAQMLFSAWWLCPRLRYGPMEWLWRSLTYGRIQPMRGVAPGAPAAEPAM
jgi:uncharacterized protein